MVDIGAGRIQSSAHAGDVIGRASGNAYLTQLTTAINGIVYRGFIACLEVPTTGEADINLSANSAGNILQDSAGEGQHVLANCGTQTLGLKTDITIPAGGLVDDYLYLTQGSTTSGTYDNGKFVIKLYGVNPGDFGA